MSKLAFDSHVISQFKPSNPSISRANTSAEGGSGFASLIDDVAAPTRPDRKQNNHGRVVERAERPAQRAEPRRTDSKPAPAKADKTADERADQVETDDTSVTVAEPTEATETAKTAEAKPVEVENPEAVAIAAVTGPLAEPIVPVAAIVVPQAPVANADPVPESAGDDTILAADADLPAKASAIGLVEDLPKEKTATKTAQAPVPAATQRAAELQNKAPAVQSAEQNGVPAAAPAAGTEEKSEQAAPRSEPAFETLLAADPGKPQSAPSLPTPQGHQQPLAQTHAAAAARAPAVTLPPAPAITIAALPIEIANRALDGSKSFEIRLDPAELGRIDVRLDIDGGGNVTSRLIVDRADTLDLLRRDAHQLERALQDAGLKTSDNGLQFSLRDQSFAGRDQQGQFTSNARVFVADHDASPVEAQPYRPSVRLGALDIRV